MNLLPSTSPARRAGLATALLCVLSGCAAGPTHIAVPAGTLPAAMLAPAESAARLERLAAERAKAEATGDYLLGTGDVISVKAYDLDDVNQRVRIDGNGDITLPLLEIVPVAGRTVAQVQADLTRRLGEYMYKPRVTVFVEEYRSQQVAVEGAVHRPGNVGQTTRNATVSDTLSAAGGPTPDAGSRIILIPVESRHGAAVGLLNATGPDAATTFERDNMLDGAIVIDTHETEEQIRRQFLDLPVRPGDVLWIPPAGKFIADGWVEKPGVYSLTPGLTVRGAIATAGGLSFPASSAVRIYRPGANGETQMRELDYADVAALRTPDVYLREGDVVSVAASPTKLPAWVAYKMVADLVHLGMGLKVAP